MNTLVPVLGVALLIHVLGEPLPPGQHNALENSAIGRSNNLKEIGALGNRLSGIGQNAELESKKDGGHEDISVTKSPKKKRRKKKNQFLKGEKNDDTKDLQNIARDSKNNTKVATDRDGASRSRFAPEKYSGNLVTRFRRKNEENVNVIQPDAGQSANQNAQNLNLANQVQNSANNQLGVQGVNQQQVVNSINVPTQKSVNVAEEHNLNQQQHVNSNQQVNDNQQQNVNQQQQQNINFQQNVNQQNLNQQQQNVNQQQNVIQPNVNQQQDTVLQGQGLSGLVNQANQNSANNVENLSTNAPPPPPPDNNLDTYNNNNNVQFQNDMNNQVNNQVFQQNVNQGQNFGGNNMNVQQPDLRPINMIPQQQPKKEPLKIVWDWSDFLINYEQYVMPEQKVRRAPHPTTGEPWPLPQYYVSKGNKIFKIDKENFRFKIVKESCDVIEKAIERYRDMIIEDTITEMYNNLQHAQGTFLDDFKLKYEDDTYQKAQPINVVNIKIRRPCSKFPSEGMDESYDVFVKKTGSYIWANEVWGALRGLETFSQLVFRGPDDVLYIKDSVINDYPRFPHRGLLIDSSRHFIFKEVIYDVLEGMAQNKMNVLHWHIVDDQSFPYQSKIYPDLSEKGAYHPSFVYSHEDIADIIEYARMRGIRIMPEFDTPGHTYSWGLSHPEIMTQCYQGAHPVNGYVGPLDPSKNHTYSFLKNLFREILHVFQDQYIHLGGDEVPMTCWSSNPDVLKLLNTLNGKPDAPINLQNNDPYMYSYDIRKVLEFYEKRLTRDLKDLGKARKNDVRFVMWQEIMNNNVQLPNDTIIQIWQGDMGDVQRAIDMGYNTLYSTCWYLDLIEYGTKWPKYYNCDPADNTMGYQIDEKKVLGGEACLWAEYIDNENLMTTLWPRASAVAERLWSSKDVRDLDSAGKRLSEHRCRMLGRGLSVAHISGPDYCLRRGHRRDGERSTNCTGGRCHHVQNVIEKFNFKVQQRGHSLADCNQLIPQGTPSVLSAVVVFLVLIAVFISLRVSGSRIVQIKICRNKTIFIAFVTLIAIYFMCYTSLWMQVQEFRGSFEKRIKSYGSEKIS